MPLRPLKLNVEEVVEAMTFQMEGAPVPYLDTISGEVIYTLGGEHDVAPGPQHERIPAASPAERYQVMVEFTATETEPDLVELLRVALQGKGSFRRFADVVRRDPDLERRWRACEEDADRVRALRWLRGLDLEVLDTSPVRASSPAMVEPPPAPAITLVDLLVLGAPDGKTELLEGTVARVFVAASADEATRTFRSLARELALLCDVPWRTALLEGKTTFATGRFTLRVEDTRLELEIATTMDTWRRFG